MGHGTSVVVCGHDPHDDIIGNMAVGSDLRIGASWLADVGGVASASRAWRFCRVLPVRTCSIAARPVLRRGLWSGQHATNCSVHSGAWASSVERYPVECRAGGACARARAMPMPRTTPARRGVPTLATTSVEIAFTTIRPGVRRVRPYGFAVPRRQYRRRRPRARQIMVIVPRDWRHPHPPPAHTTLSLFLIST